MRQEPKPWYRPVSRSTSSRSCVRYLVQRFKVLCPSLGKQKIAQVLCRAGLHLGTTTVGRILKEDPHPKPAEKQAASPQPVEEAPQAEKVPAEAAQRVVTAKRINHVWHVDLTLVPTQLGFWASWLPFSLPQCWPFGYWVAVVIDHFSRRAMGFAVFKKDPASRDVRSFLGRAMHQAQVMPKYLICDKGKQFWCQGFKDWCRRKGIRPQVWGGGPARQHRRSGTLHPDREERVYSKTPGVAGRQDVPAGTVLVHRLVQPASAAYDVGRQDTRGSLLLTAAGESKSSLRASCPLASVCPLCLASGAGQGTARSADRTGGESTSRNASTCRSPPSGVQPKRDLGRVSHWAIRCLSAPILAQALFQPPFGAWSRYFQCIDPLCWHVEPGFQPHQSPRIRPPNLAGPAHLCRLANAPLPPRAIVHHRRASHRTPPRHPVPPRRCSLRRSRRLCLASR